MNAKAGLARRDGDNMIIKAENRGQAFFDKYYIRNEKYIKAIMDMYDREQDDFSIVDDEGDFRSTSNMNNKMKEYASLAAARKMKELGANGWEEDYRVHTARSAQNEIFVIYNEPKKERDRRLSDSNEAGLKILVHVNRMEKEEIDRRNDVHTAHKAYEKARLAEQMREWEREAEYK